MLNRKFRVPVRRHHAFHQQHSLSCDKPYSSCTPYVPTDLAFPVPDFDFSPYVSSK
jgi:hypothetical protein